MKFSSRTNHWQASVNKLESLRTQIASTSTIYDLTQSNPTQAGIDYPKDWLKSLAQPQDLIYQPEAFGLMPAREAVSRYYQENGYSVDPSQVVLTASTSEAYGFLMRLLVNPYEKVLIPRPSYPLFSYLLDIHDVAYDYYDLDQQGCINREALKKAADKTLRAIMIVAPNNPTGLGINDDDKEWLLTLAQELELALIVDEVFVDYGWQNLKLERWVNNQQGLVFVLNGLSKIVGLPQMKLGWIVVSGQAELVKESLTRLEIIADTYLSVNTPVQWAAIEWLSQRVRVQEKILWRINNNLAFLDHHLKPSIQRFSAKAGWYACLELPNYYDDEALALSLLEQQQVMIFPGYFFDMPNQHTVVVSLLTQEEIFQEGIRRLCQTIA